MSNCGVTSLECTCFLPLTWQFSNPWIHSALQVETGSAITWKYPSVVLKGDNSVGEFYSVALTNNHQQADTGSKMIHVGRNTRSRIISKGISAGQSRNCYRGLVQVRLCFVIRYRYFRTLTPGSSRSKGPEISS